MPPPVTPIQGPPQPGELTWEIARLFPRQGKWEAGGFATSVLLKGFEVTVDDVFAAGASA